MAASSETRKPIVERRRTFIIKCLARGMLDAEIIDACMVHPAFCRVELNRRDREGRAFVPRVLTRGSIRNYYLYPIRRELREEKLDPMVELRQVRTMLLHAFRVAVSQEDPKAMTMALRELTRLLGLRHQTDESPEEMTAKLQRQLEEMQKCMK